MVALAEHFRAAHGGVSTTEWMHRQHLLREQEKDRERREKRDDARDELDSMLLDVAMATDADLHEFNLTLDHYDTATVEALMENQEQLDALREKMEPLLARAYVLEDGRRVFRTEDGSKVFDEFGQQMSMEDIDPDMIDSKRPTWEEYNPLRLEFDSFQAERADLIDYQGQLDEARAVADDGKMTLHDLREREEQLREEAPDAVRRHMGDDQPDAPGHDFSALDAELDASPVLANIAPSIPGFGR